MAKYLRWFSTTKGKYFTRSCVGVAAISVFGNHIAINGPLLDKVQNIFQVYSSGSEKQLSPKVQQLITEVLRESNLKEEEKKKIKFFNVVGQDLVHFGAKNSPWGCIIGIPFMFGDINDIKLNELQLVGLDKIDWIVEGQDLLECFTLSEKAKKFALMREIYSCDFWPVLENATAASLCIILAAEFARNINKRANAFERFTLRGRIFFYLACYSFGFLFYRCFKDPMKHISDKKCDRQVAETDLSYLDGGIEFYEKSLQLNVTLRKLLGSRGRRQFDAKGNENYILFTPKLPLTKRLDYLQSMKKESTK